MFRQIVGEDLGVGCVLSWGPCWYAQKAYFEGKLHALSTPENLMRYDVEVSGFPSSNAGHLCLLRLKEDDYPGTTRIEEWPTWDLPVLKWGKAQGGVVGFSHSGWGLQTKDLSIPGLEVPPYNGIGANEYIVDVTHDAVDFISTVDTPRAFELTIWYHTLNCGYRCRISGETDFPCIYGERVGLGRSYVKLADGRARLRPLGRGDQGGPVLRLRRPEPPGRLPGRRRPRGRGRERAAARSARGGHAPRDGRGLSRPRAVPRGRSTPRPARLARNPTGTSSGPGSARPGRSPSRWSSTARPSPVARSWPTGRSATWNSPSRSSGRAGSPSGSYPSSHTNPIFVTVGGKPVRASRRSADWCLAGVDRCWGQKERLIRPEEKAAAQGRLRPRPLGLSDDPGRVGRGLNRRLQRPGNGFISRTRSPSS